ncbi:ras and Rab interactor 2-like [Protopterus annectens]|uniref:ras and Rab interactor 2-like n=1 Tax=Protopterus annectens TaxID=7888 RepID=UPI001CFB6573|nr:ras and Rab interactor 2-like [Protopterus annectens]
MQEDPVYDFPDRQPFRKPVHRGSLTNISILDRLILTHPVWLQLTINSATALHILQKEPPGTFLVRKSNTSQRKVLCVRLCDDSSPSFVRHLYIQENSSGFSLEDSAISFPDLFRLISFYCVSRDVLQFPLKLPDAIAKARSQKELESISHLGVEFWNSSLNVKEPRSASSKGPPILLMPDIDLSECTTPQHSIFSEFCPIKTRSPVELDCGKGKGALCFINPLFLEEESKVRRSQFKRSFKVRVSTESSSPLSPPSNPPPPIPTEEGKSLQHGTTCSQLLRQISDDSDYKQPKIHLSKTRMRKRFSKGSMDAAFRGLSMLSPTEEEEYQTPRTTEGSEPTGKETNQTEESSDSTEILKSEEEKEEASEGSVDLITGSFSSNTDTDSLDLECSVLPSLQEVDSGSLSSLDEDEDCEESPVRPQLTRINSSPVKYKLKSPLRSMSEMFRLFLSPEKKVLRLIEEMAQDRQTTFGSLVQDFVTVIREQKDCNHSINAFLTTIRQFMSQMKKFLLESTDLDIPIEALIPENDQDYVLEKAMHKCILKPLKPHIDTHMKAFFTRDGSLVQIKEQYKIVKQRGTQAFNVQANLPKNAEIEKIKQKFMTMLKIYSPTDKVLLLLQACKLIYDALRGSSDECYGADDFLPAMAYVIAQCSIPELIMEVQYMMELLDPAMQLGEGGYYLTSMDASLTILKNYCEKRKKTEMTSQFRQSLRQWHRRRRVEYPALPPIASSQNFLKVVYRDPSNIYNTKILVVKPQDTVETLCKMCSEKFKITDPVQHNIYFSDGQEIRKLPADAHPQEVKAQMQQENKVEDFYFIYTLTNEESEMKPERKLLREEAVDLGEHTPTSPTSP